MFILRCCVISFFAIFVMSNCMASSILTSSITKSHTTLHLKSSVETVQPKSEFWLQIKWSLDPNWYIYAQNPGDGGVPPQFDFELPAGITVEETLWPKAQDLSKQGLTIYGYTDACQALVRLKASADYKPSPLDTIRLSVRWGVCHDHCIVENATLGFRLPTKDVFDAVVPKQMQEIEAKSPTTDVCNHEHTGKSHMLILLLFALIGGALLNLMPCVLPVLSLKLLDFAKMRDQESGVHVIKKHVIAYTGGVLVTFQTLNMGLIGLRLLGHHVGWGFQLQSPIFIVCLACLFLMLTLNLFGVFEVGLRISSLANTYEARPDGMNSERGSCTHSFLKGMLACIVATPCSAPFMGTAIAASLAQPFWLNTLIFLGLGVGLSLPFLGLLIWPAVIQRLPKPGAWMLTLKQLMGFLMMASTLWMVWILNAQFADSLPWILVGLWFVSLGLWIYGKWCMPYHSFKQKMVGFILCMMCCVAAFNIFCVALGDVDRDVNKGDRSDNWQPYTAEAVEKARAEKRPVLINFTARWCVTCQTNKTFVLESKRVRDRLKALNVALFEADWTHHDAAITKKLESFGQNSIPLLAYYPAAQEKPILLPALLTEGRLLALFHP